MASSSPLDEIWQAYEVTEDCLKVTDKVLRSGDERFISSSNFIGRTDTEVKKWIQDSRDAAERSIVVLLWAQFERWIIDIVQTKVRKLLEERPEALGQKLHGKVESDVEYWKVDDILDLFKGTIDSQLLGNAKKIKDYRDWVVHRNPKRKPQDNTDPKTAYGILSEILIQLQKIE